LRGWIGRDEPYDFGHNAERRNKAECNDCNPAHRHLPPRNLVADPRQDGHALAGFLGDRVDPVPRKSMNQDESDKQGREENPLHHVVPRSDAG
jgi:hypothetical protein